MNDKEIHEASLFDGNGRDATKSRTAGRNIRTGRHIGSKDQARY
jgi:hypothetical protein